MCLFELAQCYSHRHTELFYGVRALSNLGSQVGVSINTDPVTEAEILRVVYTLIASPVNEGGAGITPGINGWDYVESIYPLPDSNFTKVGIDALFQG